MAGGRLLKEHREMQKEARAAGANAEIVLAPEDGNLSHWVGHVRGPVDTPYEVRYCFHMYLFFFSESSFGGEEEGERCRGWAQVPAVVTPWVE